MLASKRHLKFEFSLREMKTMENILAVVTSWTSAEAVMQRAQFLADAMQTGIVVYRPVHGRLSGLEKLFEPDNYDDLRDDIIAGERARLQSLSTARVESLRAEWCERVHRGIVEQAESLGSGLIVMAQGHHGGLATLARTADDWHLLREAPCPVLFLAQQQHPIDRVIAAVDCLDDREAHRLLTARVLDQARAFATAHGVSLVAMTVVLDPALMYAGMGTVTVDMDFRTRMIAAARQRLQAVLDHLGIAAETVAASGLVEDEVKNEAGETALLVLGSAANRGFKGFLLGNTAERIVHRIHTELLVVN
jgi:universal stress protein E